MASNNPKLKVNILAEALLEIRFAPTKPLALIVGDMNYQLKDYPNFEDLKIPEFPIQPPEFNNMVRYRFHSEDHKRLYNLGTRVLSINSIEYQGFTNFVKDINKVLEAYQKVTEIKNISRIGLRYINKISLDGKKIEDVLTINIKMPEPISKIQKGVMLQSNGKIENEVFTTRLTSQIPFSMNSMLLDFDYYTEQQLEYKIDNLTKWIEKAHEYIYKSFKESLTKEYFNSLT